MKKLAMMLLGMLLLVPAVWAQDEYPGFEVFGGFSMNSNSIDSEYTNQFYGFQANAAFNFHENIGIVADFGGQYKSFETVDVHLYQYLFGPRFSVRQDNVTIFAQTLFGGANIGNQYNSFNGFAMGFGGGIDVNFGERVAVRFAQVDWIPSRFEGEWFTDIIRFGIGVVIKK